MLLKDIVRYLSISIFHNNSNGLTWHADTVEVSYLVKARGLIHTRVRHALVDVQLAARPHITPLALTLERSLGVYTLPSVLTRVGTCLNKLVL